MQKSGIPESFHTFKTKSELQTPTPTGHQFAWVGADGGYGKEPAFVRGLDDMNEIFVVDVHKDQRIYLEDPQPIIRRKKETRAEEDLTLSGANSICSC